MKCPSCGKELERMKRQVGTTESGDPIFNEYAVCRSLNYGNDGYDMVFERIGLTEKEEDSSTAEE